MGSAISDFLGRHSALILPVSILLVSFVIKLSVDRSVKLPHLVAAAFELPVDIMIISITVISTVVISQRESKASLIYLFIYLVVTIICAIAWRKSIDCLDSGTINGNRYAFTISSVSYFFSISCLLVSFSLVEKS
jgi:hypothetical protein